MQLIIFGAPGVGKGTQAKIISEKLNIKHISTGDMLRNAIRNETEMGIKAKVYMDKGELVPDEVMGGLVKETLVSNCCNEGFILDGYPRSLQQVEILDKILKGLERENLVIVKLNADQEVLIDRLTSRRQCSNCKSIVNLKLTGPTDTCPVCNFKNTLIKREDDDEAVIRHRLEIYNETTKPVIDYYKGKKPIIQVEGTNSIEVVSEEIANSIVQYS